MKVQYWIDWCQKQLADLSLRLFRQGYHPARIEYLNQVSPEFKAEFQRFLNEINRVMDEMAENPDGYHHFEAFTQVKMALLHYTNLNRERFLNPALAQTA